MLLSMCFYFNNTGNTNLPYNTSVRWMSLDSDLYKYALPAYIQQLCAGCSPVTSVAMVH